MSVNRELINDLKNQCEHTGYPVLVNGVEFGESLAMACGVILDQEERIKRLEKVIDILKK